MSIDRTKMEVLLPQPHPEKPSRSMRGVERKKMRSALLVGSLLNCWRADSSPLLIKCLEFWQNLRSVMTEFALLLRTTNTEQFKENDKQQPEHPTIRFSSRTL